jgi:hypothetical protein
MERPGRDRDGGPRCSPTTNANKGYRLRGRRWELPRVDKGLAVDLNSQFTHSLAGLRQPSFGIGLCLKARNAQAALQSREPTVS